MHEDCLCPLRATIGATALVEEIERLCLSQLRLALFSFKQKTLKYSNFPYIMPHDGLDVRLPPHNAMAHGAGLLSPAIGTRTRVTETGKTRQVPAVSGAAIVAAVTRRQLQPVEVQHATETGTTRRLPTVSGAAMAAAATRSQLRSIEAQAPG